MLSKEDIIELEEFSKLECDDPNQLIKLSGLNKETDFIGGEFDNLFMPFVDFTGYNLENCDFSNSILLGSNFSGANLKGANFRNANLLNSDFKDALIDDSTNFNNACLRDANIDPSKQDSGINQIGALLLIEDEPDSILSYIKKIHELFPFVDIDIVDNKRDGIEKLETNQYLFAIIDAKIPETPQYYARDLLGQDISKKLIEGAIITPNKEMRHAILTEHKSAVIENMGCINKDKLAGIVEKGEKPSVFQEKIINNIFGAFVSKLADSTVAL